MSRDLPQHPSLDHLKKQAKDLLRDSLQQNPQAQLADAQHAIARQYGFASWPKLKARVESLTGIVAPETPSPFAGEWSANLAKSTRHPANQFRTARMHIDVADGTVTISNVVVGDSGQEERGTNVIRADGNEYPSEGGNGYAYRARWRGSHTLDTVGTKDGQIVGRGRYEVSADGNTLTISADQHRIVLERVSAGAGQ